MSTHTVIGVGSAEKRDSLIVGCLPAGATNYAAATGINVSAADFWPDQHMVALILDAGSGNIAIEMPNGGTMTIPFTVSAGDSKEVLRGVCAQKILTAGTTYSGHIWPLF
jgi:hypothetical protein